MNKEQHKVDSSLALTNLDGNENLTRKCTPLLFVLEHNSCTSVHTLHFSTASVHTSPLVCSSLVVHSCALQQHSPYQEKAVNNLMMAFSTCNNVKIFVDMGKGHAHIMPVLTLRYTHILAMSVFALRYTHIHLT